MLTLIFVAILFVLIFSLHRLARNAIKEIDQLETNGEWVERENVHIETASYPYRAVHPSGQSTESGSILDAIDELRAATETEESDRRWMPRQFGNG